MKSFFKKLAFVMALAMVVTLAAPAAANAATALAAAHQISKEVVTELAMEVNDEVDLCFLGAQGGKAVWGKLNRGWKVTSGDAVTVDQNGLVKAVKNGEATIEFFMEGYTSAVVDITVGAVEEDEFVGAYVTGLKQVTLKFNNLGSVKEEDVELYRVFDSLEGEVEVFWPIASFAAKDGKMTIAPFVQFRDGETYRVKFNGENYDFTTDIPTNVAEVTHVITTYGTDGSNGLVPASDPDGEDQIVKFGYKLMYGNDLDVTDLFKDVDVEYELVSPDEDTAEDDEILDFDEDGEIVFYKTVKAHVRAVVTYKDKDKNDQEIPSAGTTLEAVELAPLALDRVTRWAFYPGSGDFSWNVKEVPAGEKNYTVVLELADTRGGKYVTNAVAKASGDTTTQVLSSSHPLVKDAGFYFEFYSTNTDTFLINKKTSEVKTYKAAENAVFYVELHCSELDRDDNSTLVETIFAGSFDIGPAKEFTSLGLSKYEADLMAKAIDDELTTVSVVVTPKHQYNNGNWVNEDDEYVWKYEIKCDDSKVKGYPAIDFTQPAQGSNGVFTFTIDAKEVYKLAEDDGRFKFTITEGTSKISEEFVININEPKLDDNGNIVVDAKNGFKKVAIEAVGNQQAYIDGQNKEDNTNTVGAKVATVKLYQTSDNHNVGYHAVNGATVTGGHDAFVQVTDEKWESATGKYHVGQNLVLIYGPDGDLLDTTKNNDLYKLNWTDNGFTIALAKENGKDNIVYADAGNYKIVIYTVRELDDDGSIDKKTEYNGSFRYIGNLGEIVYADRAAFETTKDLEDDIHEIIAECFDFKVGGKVWKIDDYTSTTDKADPESVIKDYKVVKGEGDYIIVESVTFKIPVDGSAQLVDDEDFYTRTVKIGLSVKAK